MKKWKVQERKMFKNAKKLSRASLEEHYVSCLLNWGETLDQRDRLRAEIDRLKAQIAEIKNERNPYCVDCRCRHPLDKHIVTAPTK